MHERLGHMPFSVMFCLYSIERLQSKFLVLQDQNILYPSCIFTQAKRGKWSHGKQVAGTIRKKESLQSR